MAKNIKKNVTLNDCGINSVRISGKISLVNYASEKLFDGTVGVTEETPSGKQITHYIRCKWFNPSIELEKGDVVDIDGKFGTDSYETKDGKKKYSTIVIINGLEVFVV